MLIFDISKHGSSTLNFNSSDNIAWIVKCDISKSKLALSTCNGVYFSLTALIVFTLYEIKQVKIFLGHPVLTLHFYSFNGRRSCQASKIVRLPVQHFLPLLMFHAPWVKSLVYM